MVLDFLTLKVLSAAGVCSCAASRPLHHDRHGQGGHAQLALKETQEVASTAAKPELINPVSLRQRGFRLGVQG
eukprot:4682410-Pleurochrysis_carterae.AAC.1